MGPIHKTGLEGLEAKAGNQGLTNAGHWLSQCLALGFPKPGGCPKPGAGNWEARAGSRGFPMLGIGIAKVGRLPRAGSRGPGGETRKPRIPNAGHWFSQCWALGFPRSGGCPETGAEGREARAARREPETGDSQCWALGFPLSGSCVDWVLGRSSAEAEGRAQVDVRTALAPLHGREPEQEKPSQRGPSERGGGGFSNQEGREGGIVFEAEARMPNAGHWDSHCRAVAPSRGLGSGKKTMEPASAVRFLAIAMETAVCFDAYTGGFGSGGLGIYGDGR